MAKAHILDSPQAGVYNAVAHFSTPAGANEVGVTWKAIVLARFANATPQAGDAAERALIVAGDRIEVPFVVGLEPGSMAPAVVQANIDALADAAWAAWAQEMQRRYRYYGYSQGTVS